ncbi:sulfotransferase family protein [Marinobacterium sedimentorum]|uniref:sulfotransferase family protein n=1 Tax=Marinobacterium sedimentorum TaxID=2927804 RepID=UPI0020C63185|nr:sulfotransferase [Marinobacterium sedimentorum]MCP8686260.1 sulfotransferase [Marinobacterium sedimentorum]
MKGPVFVIGFPRSGTTLARAVVGAHPEIGMVNEPELIYALFRDGSLKPHFDPSEIESLLSRMDVVGLCGAHLAGLPAETAQNLSQQQGTLELQALYESLLPKPDTPVWGEKSLNNNFFVAQLLELYPDAVFVSVVRDPRAVLLSLAIKRGLAEETDEDLKILHPVELLKMLEIESYKWQLWNRIALQNERQVKTGKWLSLRYEDLVADPESGMKKLCAMLGLAFDEQMLSHRQRAQDPVLKTRSGYAHQRLSAELDSTRISAYRKWPDWALAVIEQHCGQTMEAFDYPVSDPGMCRSTLVARLAARVAGLVNARKKRKFRRQRGI